MTESSKFLISAGGKLSWLTETKTNIANVGAVIRFNNSEAVYQKFKERMLQQAIHNKKLNARTWTYDLDPFFNIDNHLITKFDESIDDAHEYIAQKMNEPLPSDRPLYEYTFYSDGAFGRGHHIIGDGHAMSYWFGLLTDEASKIEQDTNKLIDDHFNLPPYKKILTAILWYLWYFFWLPYVLCKMTYTYVRKENKTSMYAKASTKKRLVLVNGIKLEEAKSIAHKLKATINDLAMGLSAGMIRRYFESFNEKPQDIHIAVPFDVRSHPEEFKEIANYFGFIVTNLPVTKNSSKNRVIACKRTMDWIKKTPEPHTLYHIMSVISILPPVIAKWLYSLSASKISGLITNVRASSTPLHIGGEEIKQFIPISPSPNGTAFSLVVAGYKDMISISMLVDELSIKNPENLKKFFVEEYESIKKEVL